MLVRWSIRKKLILVLTISTLLFVGISGSVVSYLSYKGYKSQANLQQARLVGAVRTSASIAAFVGNEEIANEVLNGLLQDDEILAAQIIGLGDFSIEAQSEISGQLERDSLTLTSYPLYSPIEETSLVGQIKIWANDPLITARATRLVVSDIALMMLLLFILSAVSMLAVNKLVVSPLKRMSNQLSVAKPGTGQSITVSSLHQNDEIGLVSASANRFITATREALDRERDLREQLEKINRHFNSVFSSSNVAIVILDEQGRLLQHNPVLMERILDVTPAQKERMASKNFFDTVFEEPEKAWELVDKARTNKQTVSSDLSLKAARKKPFWVHCLLTINQDEATSDQIIEIVLYDITSRILEAEQARQLAELDPLTGLFNRRGFENYLKQRFRRKEAKDSLIAMLLDLDGFKPVNDQYGHDAGDVVLQTIAKRLQAIVRSETDLVGRIGGDEFVVLLKMKGAAQDQIEKIASAILNQIATPIELETGTSVKIGVSIGIALAQDYESIESLLKAADRAMYRVKSKGKNDFDFAQAS